MELPWRELHWSQWKEERQWIIKLLKLLVSRFGRTKLRRVVKILLEACGNACLTLAYDSAVQRHRGLAEVLDLAQALIEQWRPPMLEYQATFIIRSLGALHTLPVDNISPYHEVLKECQFAAIEKDEAYPLPLPVVQNLLKPEEVTLYDATRYVIKPATAGRKCSYVELVASGRQRPRWFVSHW